ncbi:hypothetical protein [Laceyella putida]|uniref:Uncharacterized protein n=1 Tax=Laceyella putida TaxID=110101 RepID=A0ABW2RQC4_9BACL
MRRFFLLVLADVKNIRRDPMLIMIIVGPILLALTFRLLPPVVAEWLQIFVFFDLTVYYDLMLVMVLQIISLMAGLVSGYMMLGERDEQLIQLFAITPLRKSGYLKVRLIVPVLLSLLFSVFTAYFTELAKIDILLFLPSLLLLSLEAPIIALFLVAFSANKVEGLALSKIAGLVIIAPIIAYWVEWPWQMIAGILPTYWMAKVFFADCHSMDMLIYFLIGFLIHGVLLWYLFRAFERRVD